MKRVIRANMQQDTGRLVDVLAKAQNGKWVLVFEQIPEWQAAEIWKAGFATGENRFSIETEEGKRTRRMNFKSMRYSDDEIEEKMNMDRGDI